MDNYLFDKFINISFQDINGKVLYSIVNPLSGRKPDIRLNGSFLPSNIVMAQELRIRNFPPNQKLSDYSGFIIEAGYYGTNYNKTSALIQGQIQMAYQESPGPDGDTFFHILLGKFSQITTNILSPGSYYPVGSNYVQMLTDLCKAMGYTEVFFNTLDKSLVTPISYDANGLAKDCLNTVLSWYPRYRMRIDGNRVVFYDNKVGTGITHKINWVTSPPRRDASGLSFIAPWNPAIRPGDIVDIDAKFMSTSYGGAVSSPTTKFIVLSVEYSFSTVGNENSMTVMTLQSGSGSNG